MNEMSIAGRAEALGRASADAYWDEFEGSPTEETVGDWDGSAWSIHWHELVDDGATDGDYDACLTAWRRGFFGD